ncbi:hypothetical protein EVAR_3083_1 [Eumeta japonica]|uniref:Uncharacterized protein n=1 Tax=Eumeta variegata TaxID=151549 RepID=A0A4C1SWC9_EUMVA|nr:hypothetical protein EVAR_3083_1 [Eumeta japonica]
MVIYATSSYKDELRPRGPFIKTSLNGPFTSCPGWSIHGWISTKLILCALELFALWTKFGDIEMCVSRNSLYSRGALDSTAAQVIQANSRHCRRVKGRRNITSSPSTSATDVEKETEYVERWGGE